jgi:hypothetical protein
LRFDIHTGWLGCGLLLACLLPAMAAAGQTIQLEVTTSLGDGQVFREGDDVSFFVSLDRDAYLLLVYQDAAGRLLQLFPNADNPTGFLPAASYVKFPFADSRFRLRVAAPFGEETLWAFAASEPFPNFSGQVLSGDAVSLNIDMQHLLQRVRGHGRRPAVAYGEAQVTLATQAARKR